jgi:hypothetical protein
LRCDSGNQARGSIKGTTVLAVDPPGGNCPLYNRAHYRENEPPEKVVERFVSDEQLPYYSKSNSYTTGNASDQLGVESGDQGISIRVFSNPKHLYVKTCGPVSGEMTDISGTMYDMSGRVVARLFSGSPIRTGRNYRTYRQDQERPFQVVTLHSAHILMCRITLRCIK